MRHLAGGSLLVVMVMAMVSTAAAAPGGTCISRGPGELRLTADRDGGVICDGDNCLRMTPTGPLRKVATPPATPDEPRGPMVFGDHVGDTPEICERGACTKLGPKL